MNLLKKTMTFRYGQSSAYLFQLTNDTYAVSNVFSKVRRQGHATGVMRLITDYADTYGITLYLVVQRYGNPRWDHLDNLQLIEFYKKFGFEVKDEKKPVSMVREPSQE